MQDRQRKGQDPLESPLRGGQHPNSKKASLFKEHHILYAGRWLVVNNKAKYRDAFEALKERFPGDFQDVAPDAGTKRLQHIMSKSLGFRCADFMNIPAQRNLPDVLMKRQMYANVAIEHPGYEDAIFIDETGFNASVVPTKGLSLEGCRPMMETRNMSLNNVSVIAAVNKKGLVFYQCYLGGVNGATYARFLSCLFKHLEERGALPTEPGAKQLLIMDNCSIHKEHNNVMKLLEDNQEKIECLYLPPYSPFLDPCEEIFGIWKKFFCDSLVCEQATKEGGLVHLICSAAMKITAKHAIGAWMHTKKFFPDCLNCKAISTKQILDGVHPGDEKEQVILKLYAQWGLEYRRYDAVVETGTAPPPPEPVELETTGLHGQAMQPSGDINGFIPGARDINVVGGISHDSCSDQDEESDDSE
jgi:hypothetical protein